MRPAQEPIDEIVRRRLNLLGLGRSAEAAMICQKVNHLAVAQNSFEAIRYRNNLLTLAVPNTVVRHELQRKQDVLLTEIKNGLGWPPTSPLRLRFVLAMFSDQTPNLFR